MSKSVGFSEEEATPDGADAQAESGYACVWFKITAVNSHSLTVLDNDAQGRPITREIPFSRISKLMSIGAMGALIDSGRASLRANGLGVVIGKRRVRRVVR